MNADKITKTSELIDNISFKFSKIQKIKKHLDIVFVFGSAETKIKVPEKTNKFVSCFIKFIPQFASVLSKKDKLYNSQRTQFLEFTNSQSDFKFVTIEKLYNDDLKYQDLNPKLIHAVKQKPVNLEVVKCYFDVIYNK